MGEQDEKSIPIWDRDIDPQLQSSIDRVLDYMIMHGLSPHINVRGDILDAALKIAEDFPACLPPHLEKDGKQITTYLLHWLADYADETNTHYMNLTLSLSQGREVAA